MEELLKQLRSEGEFANAHIVQRAITDLQVWKRSHKNLRRKLKEALAEEARLRNHGGHERG